MRKLSKGDCKIRRVEEFATRQESGKLRQTRRKRWHHGGFVDDPTLAAGALVYRLHQRCRQRHMDFERRSM